jgi:hypothetical protein
MLSVLPGCGISYKYTVSNRMTTPSNLQQNGFRTLAALHERLGFAERIAASGAIVMVIALMARYPFVLAPGWSVDSYANWMGWPGRDFFIAQGRPGQYLMVGLLNALGFERNASAGLLSGIGLAMFAFVSPLLLAAFCRDSVPSIPALVLASLVFVLHPFQAEILTFPEAAFFPNFATSMGIVAIALVARRPKLWWLGAAMLALALSIYQLVLNYACMMVLIGVITVALQRPAAAGGRVGDLRSSLASISAIAISVLCYAAIAAGLSRAYGVRNDGRGDLLAVSDVMKRVTEVNSLVGEIISKPLLIELPTASLLTNLVVTLGVAIVVLCALKKPVHVAVVAMLAVLALPVAALGIILAGATWWPMPRVLGGFALLVGASTYVVLAASRLRPLRYGAVAVVVGILMASMSIGYRVHADQAMVNEHDRFLARSIYTRLMQTDGYDEETRLVVVNRGMMWTHPVGVATLKGDMNVSAFSVYGAIPNLFSVATGRRLRFDHPIEEELTECGSKSVWPSEEAVIIKSDRVVLCL